MPIPWFLTRLSDARRLNLIPPFHLLNIPVALGSDELASYQDRSDAIHREAASLARRLPRHCLDAEDSILFFELKKLFLSLPDVYECKAGNPPSPPTRSF